MLYILAHEHASILDHLLLSYQKFESNFFFFLMGVQLAFHSVILNKVMNIYFNISIPETEIAVF